MSDLEPDIRFARDKGISFSDVPRARQAIENSPEGREDDGDADPRKTVRTILEKDEKGRMRARKVRE